MKPLVVFWSKIPAEDLSQFRGPNSAIVVLGSGSNVQMFHRHQHAQDTDAQPEQLPYWYLVSLIDHFSDFKSSFPPRELKDFRTSVLFRSATGVAGVGGP